MLSNTEEVAHQADGVQDLFATQRKAQLEAEAKWKLEKEALIKEKEDLAKERETLRAEKEVAEKRARTETIAAALNAPVQSQRTVTLPGAGAAGLPLHMDVPDGPAANIPAKQLQQPQTVSVISSRVYQVHPPPLPSSAKTIALTSYSAQDPKDPKFNLMNNNWTAPKWLGSTEKRAQAFSSDRPQPFTRFSDLAKQSRELQAQKNMKD